MACHLAGVTTAVATCGTAFGAEHIKMLRRLLMDDDVVRGEVVFTFDGDAAGQKAALRAFAEDQRFVARRRFVAVAPERPRPVRPAPAARRRGGAQRSSDTKVPMFEFAIDQRLQGFDLGTVEGRAGALRAAAPDRRRHPRLGAARRLHPRARASLGLEIAEVTEAVNRAGRAARSESREDRRRPTGCRSRLASSGGEAGRTRAVATAEDPNRDGPV